MTDNSEDDYWNTSISSRFDFDEDEDTNKPENSKSKQETAAESIFNKQIAECSALPIHAIISKKNLELILSETDAEIKSSADVAPPIEETIKNMFCNRRYVLTCYRSLEQKLQLLDAAVETFDGNIITNVAVFLHKTLNKTIFINHICKREIALKHFIFYLIFNNRIQDIFDLYMAAGVTNNIRNTVFLAIKNIPDNAQLIVKLDQQLQNVSQKDFRTEITDYKHFLQWQIQKQKTCNSPVELMAVLLKDQYETGVNHSLSEFKKLFKITDLQEEWLQLNVLGYLGQFNKLQSLFISENWLAKRKVFKSVIEPELFVTTLEKHGAPQSVLQDFLASIDDAELSLEVGKKVKCHKFVIDYYIKQRDRLGLLAYKPVIPTQSQDYFYLENAIVEKKWKN